MEPHFRVLVIVTVIFVFVALPDLVITVWSTDPDRPLAANVGRLQSFTWKLAAYLVVSVLVIGHAVTAVLREDQSRKAADRSDPTTCLSCGKTIPTGEGSCPACGWSYEQDRKSSDVGIP